MYNYVYMYIYIYVYLKFAAFVPATKTTRTMLLTFFGGGNGMALICKNERDIHGMFVD